MTDSDDYRRRFDDLSDRISEGGMTNEEIQEAQDARLAKQRRIELGALWREFVQQAGRRYAETTFGTYEVSSDIQREAFGKVLKYADEIVDNHQQGRGLVLYGPPGTGKDHLAVATVRRAIGEGLRCVGVDGQGLFQQARDAIGTDKTEADLLRDYIRCDLLLISDPLPPLATQGGPKDYQLSILWRVIDGRYRNMRPTIITANVNDRREFEDRLSPNIVDRLVHGSILVPCKWGSHRKPAHAKPKEGGDE